jgi:hypothetical protein
LLLASSALSSLSGREEHAVVVAEPHGERQQQRERERVKQVAMKEASSI